MAALYGTAAAAGSAQTDATRIVHHYTVVSGGDDSTGVILPGAAPGAEYYILNTGSAGLKIYPASGQKINNGSANANITILENTLAHFAGLDYSQWGATFTVNS